MSAIRLKVTLLICFFFKKKENIQWNLVLMALQRPDDIYLVRGDSSVIVIACISVLLPVATGFYLKSLSAVRGNFHATLG